MTTLAALDPAWSVTVDDWDAARITHHGNLFLLSNGAMGYRGTLEEHGPEEKVGILVNGLYDRAGNNEVREPINAPNGLFTRICVDGMWLDPLFIAPDSHRQAIDFRCGVHLRETTFTVGSATIRLQAERFLSACEVNLMALRYRVIVEGGAKVIMETGIDRRIWDLNGPHLENLQAEMHDKTLLLTATTTENRAQVCVAEYANFTANLAFDEALVEGSMRRWHLTVANGETAEITMEKVAATFSPLDEKPDTSEAALAAVAKAQMRGYDKLLDEHKKVWEQRWTRADVTIDGSPEAQHALRYSLYLLLSAAPFHTDKLSIPARALSGQVYKGAIFWDTEIFMIPFFLTSFPELARNLLRYRILTLPGAREKAKEYGYNGAFYAWEGQEGGFDACTHFNVVDVFTGRPMRTYFRDKQIHVSADVAWTIARYVEATNDLSLLLEGGLEVMLECARFLRSRSHRTYNDSAHVLLDVTGPDEYHECVDNNAYTNYMVKAAVEALLHLCGQLAIEHADDFQSLREAIQFTETEEAALQDFAARLYLPAVDPVNHVIPQFDGYHRLEDLSLETLKSRIQHPTEYLGGGCGLATTTQILKQADVVLLLYLLRDQFPQPVKASNWEYYEPRTEHASSLSACAYALVATEIGEPEFALKYFLKTAKIDLLGNAKQVLGTLYIGGTHPAANGGAWMVAVHGFAGVSIRQEEVRINPQLPSGWTRMVVPVQWQGQQATLTIRPAEIEVLAATTNTKPFVWSVGGEVFRTAAGECLTRELS